MSRQTDLFRPYHEKWSEKIWLEDPSVLFRHWAIFPNCEMNTIQRLNALTRLILVITVVLWFFGGFGVRWWLFAVLGLLFVLVIWQVTRPTNNGVVGEVDDLYDPNFDLSREPTNPLRGRIIENYRCSYLHNPNKVGHSLGTSITGSASMVDRSIFPATRPNIRFRPRR